MYGSGVSETKVGVENEVYVQSHEDFSFDDLEVTVKGSDSRIVPVSYVQQNPRLRVYKYVPDRVDTYTVSVTYRDEHIPSSPVNVNAKNDLTKIRVFGDSLAGQLQFELKFKELND